MMENFNHISNKVYKNLFTTKAYDELKQKSYRDTTLENAMLFNRDALFYVEFVHAVKFGDIGRVVNVLKVWMVMMQSKRMVPKYADAIFKTLGCVASYPEELSLLISWGGLMASRRLTCYKSIRTFGQRSSIMPKAAIGAGHVQQAFNISSLGTSHTVPNISKEVQILTEALEEYKIQEYIIERPTNEYIDPRRDLLGEGSQYPNSHGAYHTFCLDQRTPVNLGIVEPTVANGTSQEDEDE
ncbi:hypothetical protein BT96DRAFT_937546 [Gymnopus androsaceus JB14]|uniref:DUF6589 domain-containing protein n=1 Tax=Gymnopus androsaceus JB14 TaxID=1447944 RepID=A0A6A4HXQ9_9AGAR|nr:hypothetical protein BT96DRAFT_937546 [Gymnopus androsaceus JB14]